MTFGVWGSDDEIAAFESTVAQFNALSDESNVRIVAFPDREALVAAMRTGARETPDVYMLDRADLVWTHDEGLNIPIGELLDERGVEFGDRYSRSALEAFALDRALQCMPYGISPTVMYYNTDLVDFDRMAELGLDVPSGSRTKWTFAQFAEAAAFTSRKRQGTKGVHVPPTLDGLAPFIYSGGPMFNDETDPTSLSLDDEGSREALSLALRVLRDPTQTLSDEQLAERPALEWFKAGKLAMIPGDRSLVPELRRVRGLDFDVIQMPVIESAATVGDITGLCVSSEARSVPEAADFVVHALSTESVREVTRAGYLAPANQEVALTDDFLQPGRQPEHASAFNTSVRALRIPPLLDVWGELEKAVDPILSELFTVPVVDDIGDYTSRIDEASRPVLDSEYEAPTESPSESPTE
nr:extracellular solute-binding protein [Nocardioides sp. zg-DK7169]